jgi:hypothetical protein
LKWNSDVYCVPLDVAQSASSLQVVDCSVF